MASTSSTPSVGTRCWHLPKEILLWLVSTPTKGGIALVGVDTSPIYYNITMGGGISRDPKFVLHNIWTAPYGSAPENSRSLMSHWCGQCWNLSWWKCRQSVSLSICGSFRHIFHLVISIQGLVKMLFRVDIQVDQGVKVLRCWHPVSTP